MLPCNLSLVSGIWSTPAKCSVHLWIGVCSLTVPHMMLVGTHPLCIGQGLSVGSHCQLTSAQTNLCLLFWIQPKLSIDRLKFNNAQTPHSPTLGARVSIPSHRNAIPVTNCRDATVSASSSAFAN